MLVDAVEWLGHSGFRVTVGRQRVYIDPYRISPEAPKADLILITHGHYDHFSPHDVERLTTPETELIAPAALLPTEEELAQMLLDSHAELPAGLPFAEWPRAVASALHTRLVRLADDRARPRQDS